MLNISILVRDELENYHVRFGIRNMKLIKMKVNIPYS